MSKKEQHEDEMLKEEEVLSESEEVESGVQFETEETETDSDATALQVALDEVENRYLRLQADMTNIRKRTQEDRESAAKYRSQNLATELLPVLDNLERALAIEVSDEAGVSLREGISMTYDSFLEVFKKEGIEPIPALGEVFDPNVHQAVQTQPVAEGEKADTVVAVFQTGYRLKDRVLRHSMVVVAQ